MLISVIIPAYDNQNLLDWSLKTLERQVKLHATECIVVDDGSKTPLVTPPWVRNIRIERPPVPRGSSAAKNVGATVATGDTLIFADSDILHLKDAILALNRAMNDWMDVGEQKALINVMRVSLPEGYPPMRTRDTEYLLRRCRIANILVNEKMDEAAACWEQNCGMIRRNFFEELGGYDEAAFKNWGFNNQDLCLRVIQAGGRVTSNVKRTINDRRLYCFHPWHKAARSKWHADKEFEGKWGEVFTEDLIQRAIHAEEEDVERRAV